MNSSTSSEIKSIPSIHESQGTELIGLHDTVNNKCNRLFFDIREYSEY